MLRIPLACSALLIATLAHADCALTEAAVSGRVVDAKGDAVADAAVEAKWDERDTPGVSARTTSDETGAFTLPIQYSTYSGRSFTGNEKCEFRLSEVEVTAKKDDVASEIRSVRIDDPNPLTLEVK